MPAIAISALLLMLILAVSFHVYRTAFYAARKKQVTADDPLHGEAYADAAEAICRLARIMQKIPSEDITVHAFDGVSLHARYYHNRDGAPVVIFFHGYRSCALRDCGGAHALFRKMGLNLLVADQRAHGQSGGRTISFGIRERRDCLTWAQYAAERFAAPIVLYGISMGAATVLMASELDLPDHVAAVCADSPYSSPAAIIEKVCGDLHYPIALCRPFLYLAAFLRRLPAGRKQCRKRCVPYRTPHPAPPRRSGRLCPLPHER